MKSSEGLNKETLFGDLYATINEHYSVDDETIPLGIWAESTPIMLDGKPFTFDKHEYLKDVYADDHPYQAYLKAAQMGLTSLGMLRAVHSARYRRFNGILYLFPSKTDTTDFSRGRLNPLIQGNPETIGAWVRDTDAANIKRIYNCILYFRGMKSRVGLKSVPADFIIFDELDEAPPNAIDMARERLSHSEHKEILKLSNPTLPDYGIDKFFQETDQRYWLLKCDKCGEYTCLESAFPDCLKTVGERVIRACKKCEAELNPSIGQWVAKRPSITDKRGYHFSQLFSHYVDPADILHQFRTTDNLTDFYNLKIGCAYVEAQNRLSVQEVLDLCGSDPIASSDKGPCSMGVDQGKDLHVVIGKKDTEKGDTIVHIGIYKDWEELDRLMKNFKVYLCVVDALPETRNARAFAERFKGRVYLNYYNEHQKGSYAWNQKEKIVQCNRAESLDASHRMIMDRLMILPKNCEVVKEFAKHMHNTAKKLQENMETGSKRYIYVKLGADHFRHAFNYQCVGNKKNGVDPNFKISTTPSRAIMQ